MLRVFSSAIAAATLAATAIAPAAFADDETINVNFSLDTAQIVDEQTATDALQTLQRQAKKACSYDVPSIKRKKTDLACMNEVIEQVVTQFDVPLLTSAYASSDLAMQLADGGASTDALQ